jgi:hypothetical protein
MQKGNLDLTDRWNLLQLLDIVFLAYMYCCLQVLPGARSPGRQYRPAGPEQHEARGRQENDHPLRHHQRQGLPTVTFCSYHFCLGQSCPDVVSKFLDRWEDSLFINMLSKYEET